MLFLQLFVIITFFKSVLSKIVIWLVVSTFFCLTFFYKILKNTLIISVNIFKARVLGINAWEHQIDETSILYSNMKMGGNCYITISFNNLFSSFDNVLCYLLILIKNKSFLKHSAIHIWCFLGHPDTRSKSFELPVPNKHTRFVRYLKTSVICQ